MREAALMRAVQARPFQDLSGVCSLCGKPYIDDPDRGWLEDESLGVRAGAAPVQLVRLLDDGARDW